VALIIAFSLGVLIGLAVRPLVNSYLLWKTAQRYEASTPQIDTRHRAVRDEHA
jgi:hypothetical protein